MMDSTRLPLADPDSVDRLRDDLAAAGYDADRIPALLGPDAHNALGRDQPWAALHVTARAARQGSDLATLVRLFLLGASAPAASVARALPRLGVDGAVAAGVLEHVDAAVGPGAVERPGAAASPGAADHSGANGARPHGSSPGAGEQLVRAAVDLRPHADDRRSYLVVSDLDSDVRPGPVRPDHVLGIGAASVMLARAVIRRPVQRALDLGTGCGIQALHLAAHAESITATDTNPRALALAAATARLNGMTWDLRPGSLFEPVRGETFDLIVSNPPFVVSDGTRRFDYRDSGVEGDGLCAQLVREIPQYLAPGGTAQLLANWVIRGEGDWRGRVGSWIASTGCDGWVVQREVARPAEYVSMWIADTGESTADDAEETAGRWLDYFATEDITGIGMGTITLRRPATATGAVPDVVFDELTGPDDAVTGHEVDAFLARRRWLADRSDADLLATYLSLADGDLLEERSLPGPDGWNTVLHLLRRPGGPGASLQLDQWSRSLFAGCRGSVPLGVQVELLADAHGVDGAALADAIMPSVRTAVTRGLLQPVDEPT